MVEPCGLVHHHSVASSCEQELARVCLADAIAAERAGFEPAEEREPLAGLANRCLGPLDYLSIPFEFYSR